MTEKKLYALTDAEARRLRALARESATTVSNYAADALTPVAVDDLGDDAIERMCKAFYEAGADKLDDTIRPQWDNLVRVSTGIAQGYRDRARAALAALLGGGQV